MVDNHGHSWLLGCLCAPTLHKSYVSIFPLHSLSPEPVLNRVGGSPTAIPQLLHGWAAFDARM